MYGHVWVVLGLLAAHPTWGAIALPLLARLYVRQKNLASIAPKHRPAFRTKLELAVELVRWAKVWLGFLGKPVWVVADGAYARAALLKPLIGLGVVVVSRLRKDAALWAVPVARTGRRAPAEVRGEPGVAGEAGGTDARVDDRDVRVVRQADREEVQDVRGAIRVVLVDEPRGWVAFFCTDPTATVADILGCVSARFSRETAFRACKSVVGAGQQQVRFVWANVGSFHLCLWAFTMTEAWAWCRGEKALVGHRLASPWDDEPRRPSHADKRRAWRRELPGDEIRAALHPGASEREIRAAAERLLNLAA
ncbi:transposase : Uncharacterized protein OS=Singulisphaera acidiphila (strain ATCC BAA-1392 / DSM 18658 / VKM B-2454 / MOB10) GN=Sinac_2157 PE=4 SV=1: DDE_5 [Gemmata massiliana]|uniref:Transposase IS4-like domain-containing protein n=1 Tax=Gemmata massiliana TaxID=1210884 RepID=A0A6P2CUS7_9BACT|nr:transposase [Gemmata massiliana]VTR90940.1 transposase : Uncharacterized protein OS=Singulisphaera acidiphila (strain ATCC BAA-1392 / DSM 18658 / VKM B-2454 / MOB10) GN=Sinac_2157 PE=4 SV=1: DDE_5 [Gemmata massiliana]